LSALDVVDGGERGRMMGRLGTAAVVLALLTLFLAINEVTFDLWNSMRRYGLPWLPGSNYWLAYSAIATSLLLLYLVLRGSNRG
jgi:phosphoglycerol transferase MdoB-like AlkP superfamily enzyme